jgi:acyl-CoA thioesterase II
MQRPTDAAGNNLMSILNLTPIGEDKFAGLSPANGWKRVFGGQVLGQALAAAVRTVEGRDPHSLHAYFILGGDPAAPITYEVDRIRDGGSFSTRRVQAVQHGAVIYSMIASFQRHEVGFEHTIAMPEAPLPETLPDDAALAAMMPDNMRRYIDLTWPVEMRPVDVGRYLHPERPAPQHRIWCRTRQALPVDWPLAMHQCVLAFTSDYSLLESGLIGHGMLINDKRLQAASLDHALWFHRPFRGDEWLLFVQDSPSAQGGRALCRGSFFNQDGVLVASVAQEGLLRERTPQPAKAQG